MQRARGAYFVNRHDTFWKELNFNFPEHQNFLKFIKNPTRKSKKSEYFSRIWDFFRKSRKFSKILIFFNTIFNTIFSIDFQYENLDFPKKSQNFGKFPDFFNFLPYFFMDFKKIWCSGKENVTSFQKVLCLFMKYASLGFCIAFSEKPMKIAFFHWKYTVLPAIWSQVSKSALHTMSCM